MLTVLNVQCGERAFTSLTNLTREPVLKCVNTELYMRNGMLLSEFLCDVRAFDPLLRHARAQFDVKLTGHLIMKEARSAKRPPR